MEIDFVFYDYQTNKFITYFEKIDKNSKILL